MKQIVFFALCGLLFTAGGVQGQCNFSPRPDSEPTGTVLDFSNGVTEDECCSFCQSTGGCTAFSYNPSFSACTAFAHTGFTDVEGVDSGELGGGPGPTTTTTTVGPTTTGGGSTSSAPITTTSGNPGKCNFAPRQDEEPTGEVLDFSGGISIDECCTRCQSESACTAFGYSPDFSVCTLWRHTGFAPADGVVGAEKGGSPTTGPPQTTTTGGTTSTTTPGTGPTTTPNPDVEFDCSGRRDGMYPHPAECARFVGCRNEQATFYRCPDPLLFDPIMETCNIPEETNCRITCINGPEGLSPHPYYCDYFMICSSGGGNDPEVFRCPPPLLFHKERLQCTFPEDVTC